MHFVVLKISESTSNLEIPIDFTLDLRFSPNYIYIKKRLYSNFGHTPHSECFYNIVVFNLPLWSDLLYIGNVINFVLFQRHH